MVYTKYIKRLIIITVTTLMLTSCPNNNILNPEVTFSNKVTGDVTVEQVNSDVKISWKNSPSASLYTVYYKKKSVGRATTTEWVPITNVNGTEHTYSGAPLGKEYYYGVSSTNSVNDIVSSNEALALTAVTTSAPVEGLKASKLEHTDGVVLNWSPVTGSGISYHVFRSEHKDEFGSSIATIPTTTFKDTIATGLVSGEIYYYRILWSNSTTALHKGPESLRQEGFFLTGKTDLSEPGNNIEENVVLDNISNGVTNYYLYSFTDAKDTDWIRYTVPATDRVISFEGLTTANIGQVTIKTDGIENPPLVFSSTYTHTLTGNKTYYFKVTPNPSSGKSNYIEQYQVSITSGF